MRIFAGGLNVDRNQTPGCEILSGPTTDHRVDIRRQAAQPKRGTSAVRQQRSRVRSNSGRVALKHRFRWEFAGPPPLHQISSIKPSHEIVENSRASGLSKNPLFLDNLMCTMKRD